MKNCVEQYDDENSFHKLLSSLNADFGDGRLVAIVWSTSQPPRRRTGMVVCQLDSGELSGKRFTVNIEELSKAYTIKFLTKSQRVEDMYFDTSVSLV